MTSDKTDLRVMLAFKWVFYVLIIALSGMGGIYLAQLDFMAAAHHLGTVLLVLFALYVLEGHVSEIHSKRAMTEWHEEVDSD